MGTRTVERKEAGTDRALNSSDGCRIGVVGTTVAWLFVLEKLLSCGSVWSISPQPCAAGQDQWLPLLLAQVSASSPRVWCPGDEEMPGLGCILLLDTALPSPILPTASQVPRAFTFTFVSQINGILHLRAL